MTAIREGLQIGAAQNARVKLTDRPLRSQRERCTANRVWRTIEESNALDWICRCWKIRELFGAQLGGHTCAFQFNCKGFAMVGKRSKIGNFNTLDRHACAPQFSQCESHELNRGHFARAVSRPACAKTKYAFEAFKSS